MLPALLRILYERAPQIQERWELLLRGEPVRTALAHPATMEFMIAGTIQAVLGAIVAHDYDYDEAARPGGDDGRGVLDQRKQRAVCVCGRNPLLAYFQAGEQALLETLVLAQVERPGVRVGERLRAAAELRAAVRGLADAEVEAFCGVCRYRHETTGECADLNRREP